MRFLEPLIGFLAFLWLLIGSLLAGRYLRDWQHKAQSLLGLSGMAFFGLILYGVVRTEEARYYARLFSFSKTFLAGISIGIFVTLWLEGSFNVFKRGTKTIPIARGEEGPV